MMNPHRYLRALLIPVVITVLVACATSAARNDLQYAQGLSASGRLADAYAVLSSAAVKNPSDKEIQAALKEVRTNWGKFMLNEGAAALASERWSDAERQYRQLATLSGFEAEAAAGLAAVQAKRPLAAPAKPPVVTSPVAPAPQVQAVPQAPAAVAEVRPQPKPAEVAAPVKAAPVVTQVAAPSTPPAAPKTIPMSAEVVAAKPAAAVPPASDTFLDEALDKRVTLQFRDASVRSLFDVIGKSSGLNVIFDRDVSPDIKTTVFLKNTTVRAAIDKIVLTSQLAWRALDENTLIIYNDDVTKQRDYQAQTVQSFVLANADAKLVASSLKTVLKFKDVVVDPKLNMVIVRDTPEAIRLATKLVNMHDQPEAEVMLEIEVLEITQQLLQSLGINWPSSLSLTVIPNSVVGNVDGQVKFGTTLNDLMHLNSNKIGASIGSMTLNASKNDGDLNLLANPRLRAKSREKAKILIGERVPNINSTATSTGFVSENITYVDVGLKIEAEPIVYAGGEVVIKLALEVSTISDVIETKSGTQAYRITTRNASTVLRLKDGENQVLAGLIQDIDRKSADKVAGLGDIPVVGRLFSNNTDDSRKTEIILSITPRIVRGINRLAPDAAGFNAGTISSVRGRRPEEASGGNNGYPADGSQPGYSSGSDASENPRSNNSNNAPVRRTQERDED